MFRPCIDLHEGKVKQIVGGSLCDNGSKLLTNFISEKNASWYAQLFKKDHLKSGHVIMLGPGNEKEAFDALEAYPGGLQIGGGIRPSNAKSYLDSGASHIILTSWLFQDGNLRIDRVKGMKKKFGKKRLVLDLSCRKKGGQYVIVTNRWQTFSSSVLTEDLLHQLSFFCDEFLIHAVNVEGKQKGMDLILLKKLASFETIPITFAGGANSLKDLEQVEEIGKGRIHLTIGSALDIFGGSLVRYRDLVSFNRKISRK